MTTSPAAPRSTPCGGALVMLGSTFVMVAAVNIVLAVTSAVWWPLGSAVGWIVVATHLCGVAVHETLGSAAEVSVARELVDLSPTPQPLRGACGRV